MLRRSCKKLSESFSVSKLPFISYLNLLESDTEISKSSKVIGESHCSRWSDIADSLMLLIRFPVRFEVPMCSGASVKLLCQ